VTAELGLTTIGLLRKLPGGLAFDVMFALRRAPACAKATVGIQAFSSDTLPETGFPLESTPSEAEGRA